MSADIGTLESWEEALVAIAAHEGKHVENFQRYPGRRARRQRWTGAQEEDRCDAYAAKQVRAHRQEAAG